MNLLGHLRTVHQHRKEVRRICFRLGLYYQGLTHDLSKYSPSEFWIGVRYYQGTQSPNNAERKAKGYSAAWLHHKGRNKHHFEYWQDYSSQIKGGFAPVHMPPRYLAEMYCDRVAASKIYNGKNYNDDFPLKYFLKSKELPVIEEQTKRDIEILLRMLSIKGEESTEQYIRTEVLKHHPGAMLAEYLYNRRKSQER